MSDFTDNNNRLDKTGRPDVICVGQAVIDCITRGLEKDAHRENVFRAENIRLSTGGDAVNEAFVLTSLGRKVELVFGAGNDLAGNILLSEARRRGVGTGRVKIIEQMETPVASLTVRMDGSRFSANSKATMLNGYLPDLSDVTGARVVSFASLFRAPLDDAEHVKKLIRTAHEDGAIICVDTKLPTFRKISLDDLREVLGMIDYIFPNEKEAEFHSGEKEYWKMTEAFLRTGIKNVIIKAGPDGCYAAGAAERFHVPALGRDPVDTTGAGDNFVAGFISCLLDGGSLRECAVRGAEAAAESIRHMGAVPPVNC